MIHSKKMAFTMIELVFVIVVIGILASLALPRMERDLQYEAADNVLSAIRYTQHLALMDNKTDSANPTGAPWQRSFWHIRFSKYSISPNTYRWFYTISSSSDGNNNIDLNEVATDPQTGKPMYHLAGNNVIGTNESKEIFIGENYGVKDIDFINCDTDIGERGTSGDVQHIAFDHLGRPHRKIYSASNDYATLMHSNCTIKFSFESSPDIQITIEQQTGHAFIVGQPNG